MMNRRNFIELFAGCGGMSLGLKSAGFDFFMGNELSPMAAETYSYNLLEEDLKKVTSEKTLWLSSNFPKNSIKRLTENPTDFANGIYKDVDKQTKLKGKFLVGDIYTLLEELRETPELKNQLIEAKIDLVSGGPPCQSFSLAGRREKDNHRNDLPWAFAEFIDLVKPKLVLLENVSGILRAFNTKEGKYFAWFEVAKAFALKGYVPICMHINAKFFGLPQNRPRFILFAVKADLVNQSNPIFQDEVFKLSFKFLSDTNKTNGTLTLKEASYFKHWDLMSSNDSSHFKESIWLPTPISNINGDFRNVDFAIGVLKNLPNNFHVVDIVNDSFHRILEECFPYYLYQKSKGEITKGYVVENQNHRKHTLKIKKRFKFYKAIQNIPNGEKARIYQALKNGVLERIESNTLRQITENCPDIISFNDLEHFIKTHSSKKQTQRPLQKDLPAPAALSIPDDFCHYDPQEDRTLTVREMARIQSFPDWFSFRAKDTTGGINRRTEVPNYTQVGNAVPPLLARELGYTLRKILNQL